VPRGATADAVAGVAARSPGHPRFRRSPRNVGLGHPLFEEARYHLDRTGAVVGLPPRSGFVQQGARLRRTAWSLGRGKKFMSQEPMILFKRETVLVRLMML